MLLRGPKYNAAVTQISPESSNQANFHSDPTSLRIGWATYICYSLVIKDILGKSLSQILVIQKVFRTIHIQTVTNKVSLFFDKSLNQYFSRGVRITIDTTCTACGYALKCNVVLISIDTWWFSDDHNVEDAYNVPIQDTMKWISPRAHKYLAHFLVIISLFHCTSLHVSCAVIIKKVLRCVIIFSSLSSTPIRLRIQLVPFLPNPAPAHPLLHCLFPLIVCS